LPSDTATRDRVLLAAMGSPDKRQIDGLGGAHPLTSKVGIVRKSSVPGVDLDFLFVQLQPDKDTVDTTPNCGNMLAAVVPFALETGMVEPQGDQSTYRVLTLNTDMQCDISVDTSGGMVQYEGTARIDGAPGTSAPVIINFLDTAGSVCAGLLPTGQVRDTLTVTGSGFESFTLDVTCIDNGMPLVIFKASDMGRSGYESVAEMNADTALKAKIEALRLQVSLLMGLGDVSQKNYPKMTLIAPPQNGGAITTRSFIPHVCHDAIGVLAAVTVGTACVLEGSVCEGVAVMPNGLTKNVSVEHPTGEFSVALQTEPASHLPGGQLVKQAALLRTARLLMRGEAMVPSSTWQGKA
jgi:4-oxalomesaconate tautomerase